MLLLLEVVIVYKGAAKTTLAKTDPLLLGVGSQKPLVTSSSTNQSIALFYVFLFKGTLCNIYY